ncbi:FecR family protein [Algoriphagus sp. Y33]|uniref:FecR family protein n=1 Tax=Algoriphagus sp. Y33 TaxID=2772483 RepID=UPI0017856223|nr:FecR domain-containing protein [Algoriphagus sp. Y33]
MDRSKKEIKILVDKYLEGSISKTEFDQFLVGLDHKAISQVYSEVLKSNFEKSIADAYPEPASIHNPKADKSFVANYPKIAATVILLICIAVVAFNFLQNSSQQEVISYATPQGEQLNLALPDGSEVSLNVASKLEQLPFEDQVKREVRLEGEAYFQVAKDKVHPFEIQTQGINILVVGTAFNVNSYPQDNTIAIAVTEGIVKVSFLQAGKAIEEKLTQGQLLTVDKTSQSYSIKDSEDPVFWREKILYFNHTDFSQVINSLERWYDTDLEVTDPSLYEIKITGQFKNKRLEEVIQSIGYLTNRESEISESIKIQQSQ